MKTLYLHVGFHKTGSSSIQQSMINLKCNDWQYITLNPATGNDSGVIQSAFKRKPWTLRHHRTKGYDRRASNELASRYRKAYRQLFNGSTSANLLLSAESLCSLAEEELKEVKRFFSNSVDRIVILAYLRPVDSYLVSAFQQNLKATSQLILKYPDLVKALIRIKPDYPASVQSLTSVFGCENVRLFAFDPASFPDKDIVVDFCLRLGIPADYSSFVRANDSLSLVAMKVLAILALASKNFPLSHSFPNISRSKLISKLQRDFAGQPRFQIASTVLSQVFGDCSEYLKPLDARLESHRPFTLLPSFSVANISVESHDVKDFADLTTLTCVERKVLLSASQCGVVVQEDTITEDSCDVAIIQNYLLTS